MRRLPITRPRTPTAGGGAAWPPCPSGGMGVACTGAPDASGLITGFCAAGGVHVRKTSASSENSRYSNFSTCGPFNSVTGAVNVWLTKAPHWSKISVLST